MQEAVTAVLGAGAVIVVAAGNDGGKGNPTESPASCTGVIAVGAVDSQANRASYSGFKPYVFVGAPGGESGTGFPRTAILSTLRKSDSPATQSQPLYAYYGGTSMAAPHVTGVIALMLSAKPDLTPDQVESILQQKARRRS